MAASLMLMLVVATLVMILATAWWAISRPSREADLAKIHRDIAALQAANEAPRPKRPTAEELYLENGPDYNARN